MEVCRPSGDGVGGTVNITDPLWLKGDIIQQMNDFSDPWPRESEGGMIPERFLLRMAGIGVVQSPQSVSEIKDMI